MTARRFLEIQADLSGSGSHDHSTRKCGTCLYRTMMSVVARELLLYRLPNNAIDAWSKELELRWSQTKFFKLWHQEVLAKRDPEKAFKKKGWIP